MEIFNPRISAATLNSADNPTWRLTVTYTARFAPHELNVLFQDAIKIWELDESVHDVIRPYDDTHENFVARTPTVERVKSVDISSDDLDTELGGEEVAAQVWLGAIPVPPGSRVEVFTPPIGLSP